MNELSFANWLGVLMSGVVEAVNTHFQRAISLHVIYLHRPWHEFPGHLAADVLLYTIRQIHFAECYPTLIVIELHIVDEE